MRIEPSEAFLPENVKFDFGSKVSSQDDEDQFIVSHEKVLETGNEGWVVMTSSHHECASSLSSNQNA